MTIYGEEKNIKLIKKYRLGYDYLFLPSKSFSYKSDYLGSMSINVLFKVFDGEGNEKLFESEELNDQKLYFENGNSCYLTNLISCSFDRENILNFEPNILWIKQCDYQIEWEIDFYTKDLDEGILEPKNISEAEFMDIMKSNIDLFDNIDNYPTQNTSYFTQECTI
ncbi:hypothetical protein [Bacillus sp. CDB3]|uniref:hypothetical protein n=1 Tax=Bacillus sp. CDB3 TaxID=360310 RepID=UPI0009D8E076|nr:hypothetical protein [Bacillus sp. CDB3]OQR53187.1 hypothetical protein CDB3_31575 [Bacillus sp. CDB3]